MAWLNIQSIDFKEIAFLFLCLQPHLVITDTLIGLLCVWKSEFSILWCICVMQFQNKSIVQVQKNPGNRPRLEGKQENIVFLIKRFHSSHTHCRQTLEWRIKCAGIKSSYCGRAFPMTWASRNKNSMWAVFDMTATECGLASLLVQIWIKQTLEQSGSRFPVCVPCRQLQYTRSNSKQASQKTA